jgi:transcriptional regulator with XRE-family HTH domain
MRSDFDFALLRSFAGELKSRRSVLGISQEQLALRADVNRTFVGKIETGKNQPTLAVIYRLSEGLECELPDLLTSVLKRYRKEIRLLSKTKG